MKHLIRILLAIVLFIGLLPFTVVGACLAGAVALLVSPSNLSWVGAAYPAIAGSTKAGLISIGGADVQETLWTMKVIQVAAQTMPFSDNMTGPPGSGKPIVVNTDTSKVMGTQVVFNTIDNLGAPIVQGNGVRVGQEEQLKPGDFRLTVDIGWIGIGLDNTARTQTVPGMNYDELSATLTGRRLAKQQTDDVLQDAKAEATAANTYYANRKTINTLKSADTFQTSLLVGGGGMLRDNGAAPINARPLNPKATEMPPPINKYLFFGTDVGMRPIKTESNYVQAAQFGQDRGEQNPLFSGEYMEWDNMVMYPWVNIRHGGYGSIGSAMQPEALLGTALTGRTTNSGVLPAGSGILDGGGSATAAAVTPLRHYFEFWSLYAYAPINGVTRTVNFQGSSIAYGCIIDKTTGKWSFFSYTGNTGNTLTGVVVAGASSSGNYSAAAIGGVTYGTAPYTTAGDGAQYLGITEGAVASGSLMIETNSFGVPLCFALGMGEMAMVCGYGNVPIGDGKTLVARANRTSYTAPHAQAFAAGLQVCWGTAAFVRPDGLAPNYGLMVFARQQANCPQIS